MEKEILKLSYVTVTYYKDKELIKAVWHSQPNGDEYRKPFLTAIEWAKKMVTKQQGISQTFANKV
jgi:hypothetical protein